MYSSRTQSNRGNGTRLIKQRRRHTRYLRRLSRHAKLIEIKNKDYSYGKSGLSEKQQTFADKWRGSKIGIVTNIDEAIEFIKDR